ncbi:hypothetical protein I307_02264 [Cryptococcus deuterogattii 99/473]|uniref:Uncharacterized protein n=1 Tax=Cryptococcus deuterogattii Ram5 TaxID=1296110 RepID=A0A0D0V2K3_9TREE|nr:hypothetical protein I309_03921 [Cryptococcus deuterogattii LA55]KIR33619.1 hypothetical protein I352_03696 [Cryptococcus deuterogattii MMRL2647]KIR40829.1 hypothetical protein I313_03485 [Cryptococcus deuterogattii Ram5]KIR74510.1 hypothetical protein I310_02117 [Cryptococcus deuterogattii CA1014]KIR94001.1 hypothetical protein I304_01633 [Cryptococcus deuterogattii CBS 10090]KIS01008.1 hypothetical protein L804_00877 [Cryptococcus deuterogattii 2001/935-1]KIY58465.1 hypothetical protein 
MDFRSISYPRQTPHFYAQSSCPCAPAFFNHSTSTYTHQNTERSPAYSQQSANSS